MRSIPSLLILAAWPLLSVALLSNEADSAEPTYSLRSARRAGTIDRVVAKLEVGGDVTAETGGKEDREKLTVVCDLDYEEKTVEAPSESSTDLRSVRYYATADAKLQVGQGLLEPALRPGRKLVGVEIGDETAVLFSPQGPLTREELELIDIPGNSLLLDRFLPSGEVAVGDFWIHDRQLMANLLGLEAVAETDVRSTLEKVTGSFAEITMVGRVDGAIYGVATEIEVMAKYRFDLKSKRINWFGLLIKEKRKSGLVMDGVEAVGKLVMQIVPKTASTHLSEEALEDLPERSDVNLRRLALLSAEGGWQLTYDRSWHVYSSAGRLTNLRLIDRGEMLTQCNISSLPKIEPEKQVSLEEFQVDIRKLLDKQFGQFVQAGQWGNEANYRVYRTAVLGMVSEVSVQWHYYLVMDQQGHQAVLAFTVESELVEQLGTADKELVNSLRFLDPKLASKQSVEPDR